MNTSGEVADLMVKEGMQITESAVKLVGVGAKELTVLLLALLSDKKKLQGKTNLKNLLKSEKPLCILQIKESDLSKFSSEAKKYGVLFSAVTDKSKENKYCDIIAKQEDVSKLNYIMEKLGYAATEQEIEPEPENDEKEKVKETDRDEKTKEDISKNPSPRAKENQPEKEFSKHGATEKTGSTTEKKKSIKKMVEDINRDMKKMVDKIDPEKKKNKSYPHFTKKKKKKKTKAKGKIK